MGRNETLLTCIKVCGTIPFGSKNSKDTKNMAFYFYHAAKDISLDEIVSAADQRWNIESCFEYAKQEVGLDEYKVTSWKVWHRYIKLSMVCLLLLNFLNEL